jgi:stalled ribosome rescue protein Dom34
MKMNAGIWIDHREAIIVLLTSYGEEINKISSHVEKQLRRTGSRPLQGNFDPQHVQSDDRQLRSFNADLNSFYDEVIADIRDAESILIFGPGVAKDELKKRLEEKSLGDHIVGIESVDNMTNPQIAAKVRQYFAVASLIPRD